MPSRTTLQLKLQSADGEVLEVAPHIYKCFTRLDVIMQDSLQTFEDMVSVPNVNASCLRQVLRWAEYHMDDEPLEEIDTSRLDICEWDRELLQVERSVLIEIVRAANYLGIHGLLGAACITLIALAESEEDCAESSDYYDVDEKQPDYIDLMNLVYDSDSNDGDR